MNQEEFEALINGYHQPRSNKNKRKPTRQERTMRMYFDPTVRLSEDEYDDLMGTPSFSKRWLEV